MCDKRVMISYEPFMQHRCVREEPHEPGLGCVYETNRMAVIREIRELLNVPDRYDVDVLISTSGGGGQWHVATASAYGVPLSPSDWETCVRAGLPMANWDARPREAWIRSFRAGREVPVRMTGARRHVDVCDRNHGPDEACTTGESAPAVDALAAAAFDSEQRARRAELEAQQATEKYVSAVEMLAEARAMLVKLEPVVVAAEALVGTWESGGISHRLGAHLHDLRAAIEGAPVPEKPPVAQ